MQKSTSTCCIQAVNMDGKTLSVLWTLHKFRALGSSHRSDVSLCACLSVGCMFYKTTCNSASTVRRVSRHLIRPVLPQTGVFYFVCFHLFSLFLYIFSPQTTSYRLIIVYLLLHCWSVITQACPSCIFSPAIGLYLSSLCFKVHAVHCQNTVSLLGFYNVYFILHWLQAINHKL